MALATSPPFTLRVGAASHRGKVRDENQDRISRFQGPYGEVFAVVDGMGGHLDGGRAAELSLAVLEEELGTASADLPLADALRRAASDASRALCRATPASGEGARMGATVVLAVVDGRRAVVAHAGDSRAYLQRGDALRLLTRDHTLVQRMVESQVLSPEEARRHPDAAVVTRALGQGEEVELEVGDPLPLEVGDRLLLCSDGLSGYVDDAAIGATLAAHAAAQAATDALITLALAAGGEDNVSVQVVQLSPVDGSAS